jgi:hypothetical protein
MSSSMEAKSNIHVIKNFTLSRKFKINGGKTKFQCIQQFLLFREKLKINVVINEGTNKSQCSQFFFTKFTK